MACVFLNAVHCRASVSDAAEDGGRYSKMLELRRLRPVEMPGGVPPAPQNEIDCRIISRGDENDLNETCCDDDSSPSAPESSSSASSASSLSPSAGLGIAISQVGFPGPKFGNSLRCSRS